MDCANARTLFKLQGLLSYYQQHLYPLDPAHGEAEFNKLFQNEQGGYDLSICRHRVFGTNNQPLQPLSTTLLGDDPEQIWSEVGEGMEAGTPGFFRNQNVTIDGYNSGFVGENVIQVDEHHFMGHPGGIKTKGQWQETMASEFSVQSLSDFHDYFTGRKLPAELNPSIKALKQLTLKVFMDANKQAGVVKIRRSLLEAAEASGNANQIDKARQYLATAEVKLAGMPKITRNINNTIPFIKQFNNLNISDQRAILHQPKSQQLTMISKLFVFNQIISGLNKALNSKIDTYLSASSDRPITNSIKQELNKIVRDYVSLYVIPTHQETISSELIQELQAHLNTQNGNRLSANIDLDQALGLSTPINILQSSMQKAHQQATAILEEKADLIDRALEVRKDELSALAALQDLGDTPEEIIDYWQIEQFTAESPNLQQLTDWLIEKVPRLGTTKTIWAQTGGKRLNSTDTVAQQMARFVLSPQDCAKDGISYISGYLLAPVNQIPDSD